jgi:hypothetical protein
LTAVLVTSHVHTIEVAVCEGLHEEHSPPDLPPRTILAANKTPRSKIPRRAIGRRKIVKIIRESSSIIFRPAKWRNETPDPRLREEKVIKHAMTGMKVFNRSEDVGLCHQPIMSALILILSP